MELYQDPRFRALTASQRSALQLLPQLMADFGRDGVLRWTPREIREAVQLGNKLYSALLETMARHEWGGETEEGWLILSLPCDASVGLVGMPADLHHMIAEAVGLALRAAIPQIIAQATPAMIEEARPGIIREYEADRKQRSRMSGTSNLNVPDIEANVRDIEGETVPNVRDIASAYIDTRAGAFDRSNDSNEVNILSIDSFDRTREPTVSMDETEEPVTLTMVPADVAQELLRHGISSERRARILVETHGVERCAFALACLPYWKPDNEGKAIESFLGNPGLWKIPKELAQGTLPLLSGRTGGAPPKAPTVVRSLPSPREMRERLSDQERQELRCAALEKLQRVSREEYDKSISLGHPPSSLVSQEIEGIENRVLRGRMQKAATG